MNNSFRLGLLVALLSLCLTGIGRAQSIAGTNGLQLNSDDPVQIQGDKLTMLEEQGQALVEGNVEVVQGDTVLRTSKMTIYYDKSADTSINGGNAAIDRLEASGGVNIQSGTQIATGEQGTFDMKSQVLTLSGKRVTLTDQGNVATGCKLTVTMSDNKAKLEGCGGSNRPTVLIQPKTLQGN